MNYLAHFHLAHDDAGLKLGAFLGDFIKGPVNSNTFQRQLDLPNLPDNTLAGIMLHRKIDSYFDKMPQLKSIATVLPEQCLKVKGILFDLFFDYALSHHWQRFHHHSLSIFATETIALLDKHSATLNPQADALFQRMRNHKLLSRYNEKDLINAIVNALGKKLHLEKQMNMAVRSMWANENLWLDCFHQCYPKLELFAQTQKQQLLIDYQASAAQQSW